MQIANLEQALDIELTKLAKVPSEESKKAYSKIGQQLDQIDTMVPQIEKLQVSLELVQTDGKDIELHKEVATLRKKMSDSQKAAVKLVQVQKEKEEKERKAAEDYEFEREYAFVPKQAFDWESVGGDIDV